MGIPGLLPQLKSVTSSIHIREYAGKRVAVDTYSWLHKGALSCSKDLVEGKPTDKYIQYCMHKVNLLLYHGVIPVMVFDGGLLPMKAGQETKRNRSRKECFEKAVEHDRSGNPRSAYEYYQKAVDITPTIAFNLIQVLKEKNIEFLVAPYEADAQMAYLAIYGHVYSVITEDSDMIPYGCPRILFKMDRCGQGMEVKYEDLPKNKELNFTYFTKQMVLEMCILSGCDYLPSIPGLGVKKAHALMRRLRCYKKVLKNLIFSGVPIAKGYEEAFEKAILTFRHQRVFDPKTQEMVHLHPLESEHVDLDFVGPNLSIEVARRIAFGEIDPLTMEPFQKECPKVIAAMPSKILPDNVTRIPSKRKITMPFQKNDLSKYFVPVSAAAKRSFVPPRQVHSGVEDQKQKKAPSPLEKFFHPRKVQGSVKVVDESSLPSPSSDREDSFGGADESPSPSPKVYEKSSFRTSASPCSIFDRLNSCNEAADVPEEIGWDQPRKRCKSIDGCKPSSFDIFRLDTEAVTDDLDVPLSLSPEWRDQCSQDSEFSSPENSLGSPDVALCDKQVGNVFLDVLDLGDTASREPFITDSPIFEEPSGSLGESDVLVEDVDPADHFVKQSAIFSEENPALDASPISNLSALQSFSTNVSHLQEYRKIGHQALDAFESSLGLFKHGKSSTANVSLDKTEDYQSKTSHTFGRFRS